jgi:tRNA threonylcarbamoyladenosine biosynthesis protein TsaB
MPTRPSANVNHRAHRVGGCNVVTMKILALDTSTEYCSAALWLDGEVRCDGCLAGQRHSQLLLPMIDALLARCGVRLADVDAVAFGEGPGSFTGLRIACGVAQGLAFGAGLPVIGVGSLLAVAQASGATHALCCIDARMGEVYAAAYRQAAQAWETVFAPGLYAPAQLPRLPAGQWTGCGSGFAAYADAFNGAYADRLANVRADLLPHAREIASLAAQAFARGGAKPPEEALPLYIRDKVALTIEEQR